MTDAVKTLQWKLLKRSCCRDEARWRFCAAVNQRSPGPFSSWAAAVSSAERTGLCLSDIVHKGELLIRILVYRA